MDAAKELARLIFQIEGIVDECGKSESDAQIALDKIWNLIQGSRYSDYLPDPEDDE